MRDALADRAAAAEQLRGGVRAEHDHAGPVLDLGLGEEPAGLERAGAHLAARPAWCRSAGCVQLVVPAGSETEPPVVGATRATSGATLASAIAAASWRVSVEAEPKPPRTPVVAVLLPGETTSRLLPRALIWSRTLSWAPWPRPTVRITEEMPMRMPSMVSADRSRCETIAAQPVRRVSAQVMA